MIGRALLLALLASAPAMAQNAMGSHPDTSPERSHCSATSTPTCDEEARLPARWWTDQDNYFAKCERGEQSVYFTCRDKVKHACVQLGATIDIAGYCQ